MDHLQTLTRALAISWRNKYLWLLALLAGEATTVTFGLGSGSSSNGGRGNANFPAGRENAQVALNHLSQWVGDHAALLWAAGLTLLILGAVFFVLSAIANGALVKAAAEHDAERPLRLGQAWSAGIGTFWPVLRLKLFALLVGLSAAVIIGGLVLITVVQALAGSVAGAIASGALAASLIVVAIPLAIVLNTAVVLGVRAIVIDGAGAAAGFRSGLDLIWRRRGRVALFWLLVLVAGTIASVVAGWVMIASALPFAALVAGSYFAGGLALAVPAGLGLGVVWLLIVLTVAGAVNAFTSVCWTLAYRRFDLEPQPAIGTQPQPA